MDLSIVPRPIFSVGPLTVTSGHMSIFLVTAFLLFLGLYTAKKANLVPTRTQVIMEGIFLWFYDKVDMATPKRYRSFLFSIVMTLFLMIIVSNFFSFYPILSQITYKDGPLFTTPTAHFSMTLVLGLFVILMAHLINFFTHPFRHIGNFIKVGTLLKIRSLKDIPNALIEIFLGLMDIIGEIAKVVSMSARLFGNLLSGDLMSQVIIGLSFYTQFFAPVPFYTLGFLSALIQAMVFAVLVTLFVGGSLNSVLSKTI